jgi:hypothetical protein
VDESVDEGDGTSCVREDLRPFGEGLVRADEDGLAGIVPTGDDLEEQIGVSVAVREVSMRDRLGGFSSGIS